MSLIEEFSPFHWPDVAGKRNVSRIFPSIERIIIQGNTKKIIGKFSISAICRWEARDAIMESGVKNI